MSGLDQLQWKRLKSLCKKSPALAKSYLHFNGEGCMQNARDLAPLLCSQMVEGMWGVPGILEEPDWKGNTIDVEEVIARLYRFTNWGIKNPDTDLADHKEYIALYLALSFEEVRGGLVFIINKNGGTK